MAPVRKIGRRLEICEIGDGVWRVLGLCSSLETTAVSALIEDIRQQGGLIKPPEATDCINRERVVAGGEARRWEW